MTKPEYANRLPILLYGKESCAQCTLTANYLDRAGIPFKKLDVEKDAYAYDYIVSMGFQSVPVVIVPMDWPIPGEKWHGFRPDKLGQLQ